MGKMELPDAVKIDFALLFASIVLVILGILTIFSATSGTSDARGLERQHIKQIYWSLFGVAVFVGVLFVNYHKMGEHVLVIYGAAGFAAILRRIR